MNDSAGPYCSSRTTHEGSGDQGSAWHQHTAPPVICLPTGGGGGGGLNGLSLDPPTLEPEKKFPLRKNEILKREPKVRGPL